MAWQVSDPIRAGLEFCADLATIADLKKITPGELLVIQERYSKAYRRFLNNFLLGTRAPEAIKEEVSRLHRWLRAVIVPLVDAPRLLDSSMKKEEAVEAGAVELSSFLRAVAEGDTPWFVVVSGSGEVEIQPLTRTRHRWMEKRLFGMFLRPGRTLPFARCNWCKRIFVITKRPQRYCSPNCMTEARREIRRKQVREAVQRHRAKKIAENEPAGGS